MLEGNAEMKRLAEVARLAEEEAARKVTRYAEQRDALEQDKKERSEARFREKQQVREKMIQRQAEYLA